jgi:hypothetical protein
MPNNDFKPRLPRALEAGDLHTMAVVAGLIRPADTFTVAHWTFATLIAEYCGAVADASGEAGHDAALDIRANFGLG